MNAPDPMPLRLTSFSHGGGCGCKIAPAVLQQIIAKAGPSILPQAVAGRHRDGRRRRGVPDQRATRRSSRPPTSSCRSSTIRSTSARIAATNAISDVYAMGGTPLFALALVGMPVNQLPVETIRKILEGGESICTQAGIPIAGGHTIDSVEPIYGLVAIGLVDPNNLKRNAGARPGDQLDPRQAARRRRLQRRAQEGEAVDATGYAAMIAEHDAAQHAGHRARHA